MGWAGDIISLISLPREETRHGQPVKHCHPGPPPPFRRPTPAFPFHRSDVPSSQRPLTRQTLSVSARRSGANQFRRLRLIVGLYCANDELPVTNRPREQVFVPVQLSVPSADNKIQIGHPTATIANGSDPLGADNDP